MSDNGPDTGAADDARLHCNVKFAALLVVLLPVLIGLGFWQLWRSEQKAEVLQALAERGAQVPAGIASARFVEPQALDRLPVELHGTLLEGRDFLLDNRLFRGRVGYELISPFRDDSGIVVLVNRGWLPGAPTRNQLPDVESPSGQLTLRGEVYVPRDRRRIPLYPAGGWPNVIQAVDIAAMGTVAGYDVYPYLVRLHPGQPGVTEADWPAVNIAPERHLAYALQWFLMAAALAIVFAFGGTNLAGWLRYRRAHKHGDSR